MENVIENKEGKYLPIGTVVMLKGGTKRAMITGFCVIGEENTDKIYDYCGCLYPEGTISSKQVLLFNHDQIDKIYHMGLSDDENKIFQAKLKVLMSEVGSKNKEQNEN